MVDLTVYDAMHKRPSLRGFDREYLDKILVKVARYRQQYPRPIDTFTNDMPPGLLKQAETRIAEQQQIDVFLHSFVSSNDAPDKISESNHP